MNKLQHSLRFQMTASLVGLLILTSGLLTAFQFNQYRTDLIESLKRNLLSQVSIASLSMDGDTHALINSDTDRSSLEYQKILKPLLKIRETNPEISSLYTLKPDQNGGWLFLVDSDPEPIGIGDPIADPSPSLIAHPDGITSAMVEDDFYVDEWGTWLAGYAPIYDQTGQVTGALALELSKDTVAEKELQLLLVSGTIFLLSLPVTIILGLLLSNWIIKPVLMVSRQARTLAEKDLSGFVSAFHHMAAGDLNQQIQIISKKIDYRSNNELGELANSLNLMVEELTLVETAFNQMAVSFSKVIKEVGFTSRNLNDTSSVISDSTRTVGNQVLQIQSEVETVGTGSSHQNQAVDLTLNTLKDIQTTVLEISNGAREQNRAVTETASIIEQVALLITDVVKSADQQAEIAENSAEIVKNGAGTVLSTVDNLHNIRSIVGLSSEKMREMDEQTRRIDSILETINEIAAQTNLLALNAAIEAARAGEHGRGFSVVADEVRKLAEKSANATHEISLLVNSIQKVAGEASSAMERSQTEVENGVIMGEAAGNALQQILDSVNKSRQSGESISTNAGKMASYSDRLVKAIDKVSQITDSNLSAVDLMSSHTSAIQSTMDNVEHISQDNNNSVEMVHTEIQKINQLMEEFTHASEELHAYSDKLKQILDQFIIEE